MNGLIMYLEFILLIWIMLDLVCFNQEQKSFEISMLILSIILCIAKGCTKDIGSFVIYLITSIVLICIIIIRFNTKQRGFEVVEDIFRKHQNFHIILPTRADNGSAGYDFYAPISYDCEPHKVTKIWTDVKAYMNKNEVLLLDVRSSMGGKFHLANTIGIIDSTYYNNNDNDGNIGIFLVNDTDEVIHIDKGDRIAQGTFFNYLTVDHDKVLSNTRNGGFGSSGK